MAQRWKWTSSRKGKLTQAISRAISGAIPEGTELNKLRITAEMRARGVEVEVNALNTIDEAIDEAIDDNDN